MIESTRRVSKQTHTRLAVANIVQGESPITTVKGKSLRNKTIFGVLHDVTKQGSQDSHKDFKIIWHA